MAAIRHSKRQECQDRSQIARDTALAKGPDEAQLRRMRTVLTAAVAYWALVFAAGFALGTLRVTLIAPAIGALAAVACELPLMLLASWWGALVVLRRWPLPDRAARLAMGALAFAMLMVAEAALARLAFGQSLTEWAALLATAPGALGIAGQLAFALIPSLLPKYPRG
jgi:hypothetical protein